MFRRFLFFALLFLLIVSALPFAQAQTDCDFEFSNYARAVQLHDMGDYARALAHYRCAQLEDPDDAIIPLLIENVYEDIASAPSAWSRSESADLATACNPAQDHALLGREAHETGLEILAQIHLHCALLQDPTHVDALNRMGRIHIDRGETHEAKHYFDRADRAANPAVHEDLLIVLLGEGARKLVDEGALRGLTLTSPDPGETGEYLPPGHGYRRTVLAVIWTSQGARGNTARLADSSDAIGTLQEALRLEPTRVDLRCELGRLYQEQGDHAAAYAQFTFLIRERLGNYCHSETPPMQTPLAAPAPSENANAAPASISAGEARYAEGMTYMKAGNLYLAANTFLAALEQDPLHLDARCRLGMIYSEWAHYRGALEEFDYILQHDRQNSCARGNRTIAARDMLAILTPLVVDDYFHYARVYVGMQEWELARDAFLKGLALDPARSDVRCELGMLHAQLGDDRAALAEFDLALFANELDYCASSNRYALLQRMRRG